MKTAGGGVDFLDLISTTTSPQHQQQFSSSTGCQSSFSSVNSSNNPFVGNGFWRGDAEKGITTSTDCGGGLSSVNSSSRDEGLGDSPTNSCVFLNQNVFTIHWKKISGPSIFNTSLL
jgi:hypothetical protein